MTSHQFEVGENDSGLRLDVFLSEKITDISRNGLKNLIEAGNCSINAKCISKPGHKIQKSQKILLQVPESTTNLTPEEGDIEIIWHDSHFAVCNKPPHLTVHPCPSCPDHTVVQRLLSRFPQLAQFEGVRPGIVHRLDKDTSGILLVALTETCRLSLSKAFAEKKIHKKYLALVHGITSEYGESREPIGRHPTQKIKMALVPVGKGGREAHTAWKRLWCDHEAGISLLEVEIFTGRTHQIRVHLSALGHFLLGDKVYAPKAIASKAPRQMLHAWKLDFLHPDDGQKKHFFCPPPDDFMQTLIATTPNIPRIVITGNPGSGKSSLLKIMADLGMATISADEIVERLYSPQGEGTFWLKHVYGKDFIGTDGSVDKRKLFSAMQKNTQFKNEVNCCIHTLVKKHIEDFWLRQQQQNIPGIAEIPLFFECDWHRQMTPKPVVIGIFAGEEVRMARLQENRGWNVAKINEIEGWQWEEQQKMSACDHVISNNGSQGKLVSSANECLQIIRDISAQTRQLHEEAMKRICLKDHLT